MENSNHTAKLVSALLVGAAIGVIGTLIVMNKDSEVGKMVAGKADELGKSIKEKFTAMMDEAKREFVESKEKATDLLTNGRRKA